MKIILIVDDKKLGKKNSVVEVADAYARNVLIPKKIAVEATAENLNLLQGKMAREKHEFDLSVARAKETAEKINQLGIITIKVDCSKDGKMFGSVTNKDIATVLLLENIEVSKQEIILKQNIKDIGHHSIKVKLFNGISAELGIDIVPTEV